VKGNGSKGASSPETEPNFYAMVPCSETLPQTLPRDLREDVKLENIGNFAVIPEDSLEQDSADGIIGLSFEIETPQEPSSNISDDGSRSSAHSSMTLPESPIAIVSPRLESRRKISPLTSTELVQSFPIPCEVSVNDAHSGDMLIFEGLPFHYLETKDVEDSLLHDI
jgi:hypothetical protein